MSAEELRRKRKADKKFERFLAENDPDFGKKKNLAHIFYTHLYCIHFICFRIVRG